MKRYVYSASDSIKQTKQYKILLRRIKELYGPEYGIDPTHYEEAAVAWANLAEKSSYAGAWDHPNLWYTSSKSLEMENEDLYNEIVLDSFPDCYVEEAVEPYIDEYEYYDGGEDEKTDFVLPEGVDMVEENGRTTLVVSDDVTSIESYAFKGYDDLTDAVIGSGLRTIEDGTFQDCRNLKNVRLGDRVTNIGWGAFSGCYNLTDIKLPNSLKIIGQYAFANCENLKKITIPNGVLEIYTNAFEGCSNLTRITIPNSVMHIGREAFWNCSSLISIIIPDSVTNVYSETFKGCTSLKTITIPDSVTEISSWAFKQCPNLTIRCHEGSYAEKYAISNDINYELI